MSMINSMAQFYRVLTGAQEMNETLDPTERFIIVLSTWVLIPCVAGLVVYYLFLYTTQFVEYMGDKLFPEEKRTPAAASSATPRKTPRKAGGSKKID